MDTTNLLTLIEKYHGSGPRYTSYPTALQFSENVRALEYEQAIEASKLLGTKDIGLYFHLPFCDTLCYFCGCTMMISNNRDRIAEYVGYLKKEIDLVSSRIRDNSNVVQIHWGGGSPTHLTPAEIEELGLYIREKFVVDPDVEMSIEVDPRGFTEAHAIALEHAGFNRASVGVQDFDPDVQVAVNRVQSFEMTREVIRLLRKHGMQSINVDLIYGLPYQTVESFKHTVEQVLELNPDRAACYNFAYIPWLKPHMKLIPLEMLPPATTKLQVQMEVMEMFVGAGYEYIGMDHYAKKSDALLIARENGTMCRNFQGYSTCDYSDLYGFGISAIGRVDNMYVQNVKTLKAYYEALDKNELPVMRGYQMSTDDRIREYTIMELMCNLKLDSEKFAQKFELDFSDYFEDDLPKLEPFEGDGLLKLTQTGIEVSPTGKLFLRNIAQSFDFYLRDAAPTEKRYSKLI